MNFTDVLKWVLEAKLEEQLAIHAVLKCNVVDPAHQAHDDTMRPNYGKRYTLDKDGNQQTTAPANSAVPDANDVLPFSVHLQTEPKKKPTLLQRVEASFAARGKKLKPGRYKMRVASVTVPPAKLYAPAGPFGKRWWRRLQNAKNPLTPQQLAGIAGAANRSKEVSTQLGILYNRGIVDRKRKAGSTAFLYSIKETLR